MARTPAPWLLLLLLPSACSGPQQQTPLPFTPRAQREGPPVPMSKLGIPDPVTLPSGRARVPDDPSVMIPPPPVLSSLARNDSPPANNVTPASAARGPEANSSTVADPNLAALQRIYRNAANRYASIDSFEARLTRREAVAGKQQPTELLCFRYRQKPFSVHFKWIGSEGQGREVLYVERGGDDKLHILTARGDMFPLSPPSHMVFAPDSPLVRSKSRHHIREAGMHTSINHLGEVLRAIEKNPALASKLRYRGLVRRPEYGYPLEAVEETIGPREEELLPQGGSRTFFFDPTPNVPSSYLPVLVITRDPAGREVEYYCFDRFLYPIKLDDADFDPAKLWRR